MSEKTKNSKGLKDPLDKYMEQSFYKNTLIVLFLSIWSVVGFHTFIHSFPNEVIINEFQLPLIIGFVFAWNMVAWLVLLGWLSITLDIFGLKGKKDKKPNTIEKYLGEENE